MTLFTFSAVRWRPLYELNRTEKWRKDDWKRQMCIVYIIIYWSCKIVKSFKNIIQNRQMKLQIFNENCKYKNKNNIKINYLSKEYNVIVIFDFSSHNLNVFTLSYCAIEVMQWNLKDLNLSYHLWHNVVQNVVFVNFTVYFVLHGAVHFSLALTNCSWKKWRSEGNFKFCQRAQQKFKPYISQEVDEAG